MDDASDKRTKPEQARRVPVVRLAELMAEGRLSQRQIADELGCNVKTLARWRSLPEVERIVQRIHNRTADDAANVLAAAHRKAARKLVQLMSCGDPKVERAAAMDVLGLNGRTPKGQLAVTVGGSVSVGVGSLEDLKREAAEVARRLAGAIVVDDPGPDPSDGEE